MEGVGDIMMNVVDTMSTSGDVQYIGGCSVHWGDTMSTSRGYHEYIVGCSVHQGIACGEQVDKIFSISVENPDVLMISTLIY